MWVSLLAVLWLAEASVCVTGKMRYDNHRLLRVHPTNRRQVRFLDRLRDSGRMKLDFWTQPSLDHDVDIRVPPSEMRYTNKMLRRAGLTTQTLLTNIQNSLDAEVASMVHTLKKYNNFWCYVFGINCNVETKGGSTGLNDEQVVGRYARHDKINAWLDKVASQNRALASVVSIGTSYEGRDMRIIKIGSRKVFPKPIIWIEAGIHAREWIAPAVAVWTINKLVKDYGVDKDTTYMLDTFDFHILPSANPDGYEYSHTNERLWRKTRSPQKNNCYGVDPNRNFDVKFGGAGTSKNPCSEVYHGTNAFSESETANIRNTILNDKDRIKVFLSFHSYSQFLLTPYGSTSEKPPDYAELLRVADASMAALKSVYGKEFQIGTPPEIIYVATGGSYDWVKQKAGVKYSYTYELRPSQAELWSWQSGFILNEDQIVPSAEEVWASLVTLAREVQL